MSILDNYRINFFGGFTVNPCTSNNDQGGFYLNPTTAMLGPELINMTDVEAINTLITNGGWNYEGNYYTNFVNATVSSFGSPGKIESSGALIGRPIQLLASMDRYGGSVIVDVDSTGVSCTQLITGGILIGDSENPSLKILSDQIGFTRYSGNNAYGSVSGGKAFEPEGTTWQVSFPSAAIVQHDSEDSAIQELVQRAKLANGFTLSISFFGGIWAGKSYPHSNPVLGYAIGTLGVRGKDDLATCAPGRVLQGVGGEEGYIATGQLYAQEGIGAPNRLSLGMVYSFKKPSRGQANRDNITKIQPTNAPKISLVAGDGTGDLISIPYDNSTYQLTGGIVDLDLTEAQSSYLISNPLKIVETENPTAILFEEIPYRIESDSRGVYNIPHASKTLNFRLSKYGQPVSSETPVYLNITPSGGLQAYNELYAKLNSTLSYIGNGVVKEPINFAPDGNDYLGQATVTPSQTGEFSLELTWAREGCKQLNIGLEEGGTDYFLVIRNYPIDSYDDVPVKERQSWEFIYENIFRYYYVIFPAMSKIFKLNCKDAITNHKNAIEGRIRFGDKSTLKMPITRDMSPGKTQLLLEYLDSLEE